MTRRGLEIRVGFVVVLAGIIVVVGVMWFQKFKLVEKSYGFFVRFNQVGGLQNDDRIVVDGVESGRVRRVDLAGKGVVVELGVRQGVLIPDDSRVMLKSVGIMGDRFVSVLRGTAARNIAPGDTIDGQFLMGLSEVMGTAGKILDELAETSRSLRELLDNFSEGGRLEESLDNFAAASKDLRAITHDNQPRLAAAIERFEGASTRLDSLLATHYTSLDSSMTAFGRAGGNIGAAVDNMARASEDLRSITERLRGGEGSLGKLLSDDELVDRLTLAVANFDSLVNDMKLHPGRYVTLKLF